MEVVENTLETSIETVLERPLFCFLSTLSTGGEPRISPFWYLWEDGAVWMLGDREKTYTTRIENHPRTALAIVDFDVSTGVVNHIGMRGEASIHPHDPDLANRLLRRYLGADKESWADRFLELDTDRWQLIRVDPDTVVARDQSYAPSRSLE